MFQRQMRIITEIILTLLTLVAISCSGQININDYIDRSQPIQLTTDNQTDSFSIVSKPKLTITKEDQKFKDLVLWGNENLDKWKSTPASYAMADIYLTQGNFHLRYWKSGFVVVEFKDKKGKQRQMTRKVKDGDFGFLIK
jgi:hypothetical protein